MRLLFAAIAACLSFTSPFAAESLPSTGPDAIEPGSVEAIARATTEPRFSSPWVSYVPASATVPSPTAFLGRIAGAPGELIDSAKTYAYARALAAHSPRVRVFSIGRSEEGREILLMAIADEKGIESLDALRAASGALADPRRTDPAAAEKLIAESRPFYYFNAGLHADETGSTESMLELAYRLVGRLLSQHIEVSRSESALTLRDGQFPPGTYVVRLDQPYRNYAVDLLSPQQYPKDGGEPYDDVSWELSANFHLQATPTADAAIRDAALVPLSQTPEVRAASVGTGPIFLLKDSGQEGLLEARFRLARFRIEIAEQAFSVGADRFPAGSWIVRPQAGLKQVLTEVAEQLDLPTVSVATLPSVVTHSATTPRVGVWVPWADTDSIGWLRYSLDQRKIPYVYFRDEDIRAGALRKKVDVLLYGHVDLELAEQIHGIPRVWGPMPFKKTAATPSFGTPAESDDITGGIGWQGFAQIQAFVDQGGLMVTLGSGSMLAIEGGIVRGVRSESGGVPRSTQGGGVAAAAAAQDAVTRTPGAHVRV